MIPRHEHMYPREDRIPLVSSVTCGEPSVRAPTENKSCPLYFITHLDLSQHPGGLHSAGHVDAVAPDVILGFLSADHACDHWPVVYPWQEAADRTSASIQGKESPAWPRKHSTFSPILSLKSLNECLLMTSSFPTSAKANSTIVPMCMYCLSCSWGTCRNKQHLSHVFNLLWTVQLLKLNVVAANGFTVQIPDEKCLMTCTSQHEYIRKPQRKNYLSAVWPRGHIETSCSHVGAANGLNLLHPAEFRLG